MASSNGKSDHANESKIETDAGQCEDSNPTPTSLDVGEFVNDPVIRRTVIQLYRAYLMACDCGRIPSEFALGIEELRLGGATTAELKWLLEKNWILVSGGSADSYSRESRYCDDSSLIPEGARFCLTEDGASVAQYCAVCDSNETIPPIPPTPVGVDDVPSVGGLGTRGNHAPQLPQWDDQRHELRFGNALVKQFKWRASNQERILSAFEEDGWPARIDDPLPPHPEIDSKRRLSDTIKCLNRNQRCALIRFVGDGTGEGVIWRDLRDPD